MYKNILLVEDEARFAGIVARNLQARGSVVTIAPTAEAGITQLDRELPDLILLDINLPGHSGWDVLRHLRNHGKSVPVVVVSAVRVSRERLDEFKPLAYLPKPFPLDALLRIVAGEDAVQAGADGSADAPEGRSIND